MVFVLLVQGHKQDYVSGEIAVPKFHCPRCRDHYYGLTPYPCDEELARLIREGLWRTGEGASPDKSIRHGMMRASLSETNIQKNRKSNKDFSSSSKVKLPPLNANNNNMTSSNVTNQGNTLNTNGSTSTNNRGKNKSKKISFALDNDHGASPSTSKTSLNGHGQDDSSDAKGRKRRIGDESKRGRLGPNKGSITSLNDTDNGGSNSSLDRYRIAGHQKKLDNQSSTSKLIDSQTDAGIGDKGKGDKGKGYNNGGSFSSAMGSNNGNNSIPDGETGHGNTKGLGVGVHTGLNADGSSTTMLTDEGTMTNSNSTTGTYGSGSTAGDGSNGVASKHGNKSSESTDGSGKKCGVVNCQNKINSKADNTDSSGKKAHKAPAGYMRAASPSQSDWGDPTHAKKWINNTAPPHPTFRYADDDNDGDDDFSSQVFNPRSWRQQKKPSTSYPDDPLLLPIGPTFTRAFTFSYMPGSSAGTKAGSNSAVGGKKSRKKTT